MIRRTSQCSRPPKPLVVLGGKMSCWLPRGRAQSQSRYLGSHGVQNDPNGSHGQPFVAGEAMHSAIMSWLELA
ncbi:hypothetical protein EV363DRAFT_1313858 [Boletus edulis]|nr:hypothetical protein EV363DRAFT_1313858 [Boletus edulis]